MIMMWCLYFDHSGRIDQNLFEGVMNKFPEDKKLIPTHDRPPEKICQLTHAVDKGDHVWAFIHTERYEQEWIEFAERHKDQNQVRLVLLSRDQGHFERQGTFSEKNKNVYGFAPASDDNPHLMKLLNSLLHVSVPN